MQHIPDVSVIMPFADDEDVIGIAVRRLTSHLSERGLSFELIAVDEDSGDNSHAVLALLRPDHPALRITHAPGRGRGFAAGALKARGRLLWMIEPAAAATAPLAPLGRAYRRVQRGEADLVSVGHRFVVCHRAHCLPAIGGLRGAGYGFQRKLLKRAAARGLVIDQRVVGGARPPRRALTDRGLSRLLGVLAPARRARNLPSSW